MKELIDKVVMEFSKSGYPHLHFFYSDERLEVEIRIAHYFPIEIQSFVETQAKPNYDGLHMICPALERIEIKDPFLQNKGFFSYLITKLLAIEHVQFVVVQNVHSKEFAHSLYQSRHWKPILYHQCLKESKLKQITPLLRNQPRQFEYVNALMQEYIDKLKANWCMQAIERINELVLNGDLSDDELIEANKLEPLAADAKESQKREYKAKLAIQKYVMPLDRKIAAARGESLAALYGKTIFDTYYTTEELFNASFD